jgi:hypothetical protein
MASVGGGLFQAAHAPTAHVTAAARPTAGTLGLAQVTAGAGSSGPQADARFTGAPAGSESVVATQAQVGGTTMLTLHDGSVINIIGSIHFDVIIH